jgi:hypothetical protein
MDLDIELSKRPVPDFPPPPAELAELGRAVHKEVLKELKAVLKGTSEAETGHHPSPGEWSVRDVMAHLLVSERWNHAGWDRHAEDQTFPGYPGSNRLIAAIGKTYSTKKLFKELKRSIELSMNMIESLPEKYAQNKAAYFITTNDFEDGIRTHWRQHTDQIKAALESAREEVPA